MRISGPLLDKIGPPVEAPQVKFNGISAGRTGGDSAAIHNANVVKLQSINVAGPY